MLIITRVLRIFSKVNNNIRIRSLQTASFTDRLCNLPFTELSLLDNGIRVVSEDSGARIATVGIWIATGSRYEQPKNNGVSNFLEHMVFKGTSKRSQSDLEMLVENMGAQLNAYTSRDKTVFYAKCNSEDVPAFVEILADIIQNPSLSESQIEQARCAILCDMQAIEKNPRKVVFDYLHSAAYQGTPLGQTVLGPTKNIMSISQAEIQQYMRTYYQPTRIVLVGAGGVEHCKLLCLARQYLGNLQNAGCSVKDPFPCRYTGSDLRYRNDSMPLCHVAIAVESPGYNHAANIPLMVASQIIGSWDRSKDYGLNNPSYLAQIASLENVCHSFQSFNISYKDTGLWGCYFIAEPMQLYDITGYLLEEWMKLCIQITEGDVERAKNALKTNMLLQLDDTTSICEDIGRQMLYQNYRIPIHELNARIDFVEVGSVREVCMNYIYDKCPAVAAVGPTEGLPDYTRIRAKMVWWRM